MKSPNTSRTRLKPEDPLFKERHKGSRLTRNLVWFMLRDYGREIGVENLNARMLRNTFIAGFLGQNNSLMKYLVEHRLTPLLYFQIISNNVINPPPHSPKEIMSYNLLK